MPLSENFIIHESCFLHVNANVFIMECLYIHANAVFMSTISQTTITWTNSLTIHGDSKTHAVF